MSRNYRKCGGCRKTSRYCDCKDYGNVNFDTHEAVTGNEIKMSYFGTKNFGFYLPTGDGVLLHGAQFQSIAFDGLYYYVGVCDKSDTDGCIIKYDLNGALVSVGPLIPNIGHAKIGYSFEDHCIYASQRLLNGDWSASGMHKIDKDTLASVEYNATMSHQVTAFVQYEKELYYIGSDSTKMYSISNIDVAAGTFSRELAFDIPVPADFYSQFNGTGLGVQAWFYDGRTIIAVRNNPQFAMIYDTVTKKYSLSKIGDVSEYRNIGEIEGAFTWNGRTTVISVNDIADPIQDAFGHNYADIYILFWYWDISRGASGSLNFRENTHPNYSVSNTFGTFSNPTTTRQVCVNVDKDNFYCNGSTEFPFHSLGEAIDYYSHIGVQGGIYFQSDFTGFCRVFNQHIRFQQAGGLGVDIRFTDCQSCDIIIDNVEIRDGEFYNCNLWLVHNAAFAQPAFDTYFNSPNAVSKVYNGVVMNNVYRYTHIYTDDSALITTSQGVLGDIWINSGYTLIDSNFNH